MLEEAFARRYPLKHEGHVAIREQGVALCRAHLDSGLADRNAEQRLCSADDGIFWQQLSEVLLADQLRKAGLPLLHAAAGPDFLIEVDGQRTWVEVICPTPAGIPAEWLAPTPEFPEIRVRTLPDEAVLLRWTSAIKEKAEKLLGTADGRRAGYLAKGIVAPEDAYVVAINGRLLRGDWPDIIGISQYPFAAEATLCVGPYEVRLNRETLETVGEGLQHRPTVLNANGAPVPADTFFDPRFAPVSAIWATDVDENLIFDQRRPMAIVHNPIASRPLPVGLLPAQQEYVAVPDGDRYLLETRDGRLR